MKDLVPCDHWKEKLSMTHFRDLSPSENAALTAHIMSCPACESVRASYHEVDALLRSLPPIEPLPGFPAQLLKLWEAEDSCKALPHSRSEGRLKLASLKFSLQLERLKVARTASSLKKLGWRNGKVRVYVLRNGLRIVFAMSSVLISLSLFHAHPRTSTRSMHHKPLPEEM